MIIRTECLLWGKFSNDRFWPGAAFGDGCPKAAVEPSSEIFHCRLTGTTSNSHNRPGADLQVFRRPVIWMAASLRNLPYGQRVQFGLCRHLLSAG